MPNGSDTTGLRFEVNNNEPGDIEQIGAFYGSELLTGQYTFRVDIWSNWCWTAVDLALAPPSLLGSAWVMTGLIPDLSELRSSTVATVMRLRSPTIACTRWVFGCRPNSASTALGTFEEDLDNSNPILTAALPAFDIATAVPAQGQSGIQQAGAAGFQWMTVNVEVDTDAIGPSGADTDPGFARFSMRSADPGMSLRSVRSITVPSLNRPSRWMVSSPC